MSDSVLHCNNVSKVYREGLSDLRVLNGINFHLKQGDTAAICGTSGAGKSTLLKIMGGLDSPTTGQVLLTGMDINNISESRRCQLRNQQLGFVYQFHHLLPEFNAIENIAMPLRIRNMAKSEVLARSHSLLEQVGLSDRAAHRVGELSGGERQRIALARALVTSPACVLADEPTGNLDDRTSAKIIELILNLNSKLRTSFVVVTHDKVMAESLGQSYLLSDGRLG